MSLNSTPSADRVHIGIFGRRNAGKSSIINAITGQNLAIVSNVLGTTTDPVPKAMELLPLGPVVIIDTPGLDDIGELGELRVKKAYQILNKTDIAVLVIDASLGMTPEDLSILKKIQDKKIPYVVVKNKSDLCSSAENGAVCPNLDSMPDASFHIDASNSIEVSTVTGYHVHELKELIASQAPEEDQDKYLVRDLLNPNDFVVLVVPIDSAAPKGRLILPQQQTIRDVLEAGAISIVGNTFVSWQKATPCHHRQPGICQSVCRYTGRYSTNLFFHPAFQIQRKSETSGRRRTDAGQVGRW